MNNDFQRHVILRDSLIKQALAQLDKLAADAILFVVDENGTLLGSLTDGDVRRGFLRGLTFENRVMEFVQPNPKSIRKGDYSMQTLIEYREKNFRVIPVVDRNSKIVNVINFRFQKSFLPIDAVVMAGGRGERLRPLTDSLPKPLLQVGEKPIIEHNIDRLLTFGIVDFWITLRYKAELIQNFLNAKAVANTTFSYVIEDAPLGTIGSLSTIENFSHDHVLVTNSDLLTNLDYEAFFLSFIQSGADLSVATIPYEVNVPYAVLETTNGHVMGLKEKPTYTYYSNAGIYLLKRSVIETIPKGKFFNATDLMDQLIQSGRKVHSFPFHGYWLDIGKMEDFRRAQVDIATVKFG